MKDEVWVTLKRFLPHDHCPDPGCCGGVFDLSSCKPKTAEKGDVVISEDGEEISEPQKDYDAWEYSHGECQMRVDRQSGDVVCTPDQEWRRPRKLAISWRTWERRLAAGDALATDDVSTFIFKRLK